MAEGFYEIAAAEPGRRAIIEPGGASWTYGALHTRVNQVSHGLRALGCGPGGVVAAVLPNEADHMVMQLATGQLGVRMVPINWHLTPPEIEYILTDSGAALVVAGAEFAAAVSPAAAGAGIRAFVSTAELTGPDSPLADRVHGQLMFYTSGTTGRPKGVRRRAAELPPEGMLSPAIAAVGEVLGLLPGDGVHLVAAPLYHSAPGSHALMALHLGHTVVLSPKFDPETVLGLIERHRVTNTFMVPTMFHRLLALPETLRLRYDISSLRNVIHAAAACPPADKRRMIDWFGPVLYEYYGSTESQIVSAVTSPDWLAHPGTVGRPVRNIDVKILDESGEELRSGEPGLIYASVAAKFEYHGDPAKTASTRRGDYYTPGDIGYLDRDGYLYLCDRRTDLIISGGVNIYPAEIEAVLLEHPSVADVVVFGIPEPEWGQQVVALVQPSGSVTERELMAHCDGRLARFKHPRVLEFRPDLPRTPTGKMSRYKVRESYLAGR